MGDGRLTEIEAALATIRVVPASTLTVTMRALDAIRLPGWLGSLLHGALGHGLRSLDDGQAGGAFEILLGERPAAGASPRVRAAPTNPLVLVPPSPDEASRLAPGDVLRFGVLLMGRARDNLSLLVAALEAMGRIGLGPDRGRAVLDRVSANGEAVWSDGRFRAVPVVEAPSRWPTSVRSMRLRTHTPLELVRAGALRETPAFEDLVDAALWRLIIVAAYHGEGEPALRVAPIVDAARDAVRRERASWRPFEVERWSERQGRRHPMAGVLGELVVEGDVAPWFPLLHAAGRLGIGKHTSFGFGQIRFEVD